MDILINLTIIGYKYEKGEKKVDWEQDFRIYDGDYAPAFTFNETDNIGIIFSFDNSNIQLSYENAVGELEEAKPYEEINFHSYQEGANCYFPGSFDLLIIKNGKKISRQFTVNTNQLDNENIFNLRDYVNSFYNGLSLDLTKKRKASTGLEESLNNDSSFMNYNFIFNHYPNIMNYINRMINEANEELVKKSTVSTKFSGMNGKSINWLLKKGFTKNADINKPNYMLTRKSSFTLNSEENRIFKSYVLFWDSQLNTLIDAIGNYIRNIKIAIDGEKANLIKLQSDIQNYKLVPYVSKKEISDKEYKIVDIQRSIDENQQILGNYEDRLNELNKFKTFTSNCLSSSWLFSVVEENNYESKIVRNKTLMLIKEQKDRYLGSKRKSYSSNKEKMDYFAQKGSAKLFETYFYIMLINILRDNGFELDDHLSNNDLMYLLSNESDIIMKNEDNLICEIHYDQAYEKFSKTNISESICSINSKHNKPDFVLVMKDKDQHFINAIVLEMKWRNFKNIFNEVADTDVMLSLEDYLNLGYCKIINGEAKLKKGAIQKVIVVHPDAGEHFRELVSESIYSQGLPILSDINNTESYKNLDGIIKCFINCK